MIQACVGREWHVVGDSHVGAFQYAAEAGMLTRSCRVSMVGGATAVGLRNPNAKTDAMAVFKEALLPYRPQAVPVVHLGEVDCGFVIWYRAAKYGESIEQQTESSILAYFGFVDLLVASGYSLIVIAGTIPPTIRDGQEWGDIANARREVKATLRERTDLTISYNVRLNEEAQRRRLPYIDLTDIIIDRSTRVVDDKWRHPDAFDHHLDPAKTSVLWANKLNVIDEYGR